MSESYRHGCFHKSWLRGEEAEPLQVITAFGGAFAANKDDGPKFIDYLSSLSR